jgi:photosystem II stability/assembly factor-like uncharacterized protein
MTRNRSTRAAGLGGLESIAMRLRIVIAVLLLAASMPSRAGSNEWTVTGPFAPGGTVTSLAIDPTDASVLYAGTYRSGVFKSTDGGETWFPAGSGLRIGFDVDALVIDPTAPEILYAANGGFVFRSANGGQAWERSSPDDLWPRSLAVDPTLPRVIYAGGWRGLFRSEDSGMTWSGVDGGLGSPHVLRIAIDPLSSSTLYVATYTGLFKTVDAGRSWTLLARELFPHPDGAIHVAIHPLVPDLVYAGSPRSLFRSQDGGASWTLVRNLSGDDVFYSVTVTQTTVLVGTYRGYLLRSGDAGASWTESQPVSTGWVSTLVVDPTNPSIVFAGSPGFGVRKSRDGGDTWSSTRSEFQHVWVSAIRIDPITPSTVYAAAVPIEWAPAPGGVFKSTDGARSWLPASEGLTDLRVNELLIDPSAPSVLYAGAESGVFRSADAGRSWRRTGSDFGNVLSLALDPRPPSTLFAGTGTAVYRSTDSGETWREVLSAGANKIVVDPVYPSIVYAGGYGAVFKSHDRGEGWSRFATGLPSNFLVSDVVISALFPTRLLAGGYYVGALPGNTVPGGSMFASRNAGASWKRQESFSGPGVSALVPDPVRAGTHYASLLRGGVAMTTDFGVNWSLLTNKGLDTDLSDLVVASSSPLTLYAGGYGGVFQFTRRKPDPAGPATAGTVVDRRSRQTRSDD